MKIPKDELLAILSQFNPWWRGETIPDLPQWKRAAFKELLTWVTAPPAHRAVMVSGARQVGKTTLIMQVIANLIESGVPAANILYITFDHPIFKLSGLGAVLEAWRELEPKASGPEYLFLDEAQFIRDFGTWVKHEVDFNKQRRIVSTGSAMPIHDTEIESGVGRWHTLRLATLSFYEYLQLKQIQLPAIPEISMLTDLFKYSTSDYLRVSEAVHSLIGHFHEYLIRGGFPQTALIDSISQSQRLMREDIIDKVLKRDMTALFGVRRVIELEQTFIFLCMHDGGIQDLTTLSKELGVTKPTVQNFIHLLESTHLLYRLPPFGHGKEVLRARYKLYLADPAISPAILMKGKTILEDAEALSTCVETAIVGHLSAHATLNHAHFSYWRGTKEKEVDLVIEIGRELFSFEVKYRSEFTQLRELAGMVEFRAQKKPKQPSYILTKSAGDVGPIKGREDLNIMRIPAAIFCYWLGRSEILGKSLLLLE